MAKLKGNALDFCARHITTYRKMTTFPSRLYVYADDKQNGERIYQHLSSAYAPRNYSKGWDWADFELIFNNTDERNSAYSDMDKAITSYRESHPDTDPDYDPDTYEPTTPTTTGTVVSDEDTESPDRDYTTYIIIGAAAIILVMLLWERKKK